LDITHKNKMDTKNRSNKAFQDMIRISDICDDDELILKKSSEARNHLSSEELNSFPVKLGKELYLGGYTSICD